jgi:hypothetical protein
MTCKDSDFQLLYRIKTYCTEQICLSTVFFKMVSLHCSTSLVLHLITTKLNTEL